MIGGIEGMADRASLRHPSEVALAKVLGRFAWEVRAAARDRKAHALAGYALEVAVAFHAFYRDCPVARAESGIREARMELTAAAAATLRNALGMLGITAPDAM